jgi:hypothetical protein
MKAVTIDNLDIKAHEQYARDQVSFDPTYIVDAVGISPHFEIAGTSSIYSSKWEELFELSICNIPWAMFAAPPLFTVQRNKYFRYRILPSIEDFFDQEEEEEDEETQFERTVFLQKVLNAKKEKQQSHEVFERERSALLNFFQSAKVLNKLLAQINARKLQYQKG